MEIISNNYENVLKNLIFTQFFDNLKKETDKNITRNNVFNYIDMLSNLENSLSDIACNSLTAILEAIDTSYRLCIERKSKYHIRAYEHRTILTIFGEITFKRTFYSHKDKTGCYCYLDDYLGLAKHDYFDPYIKAKIVELSAIHSMNKVRKIMNDMVGSRITVDKKESLFSRQIIHNIVNQGKISTTIVEEKNTPKTLYVMADEKWVSTQNNDKKDVMVKSIVVFDDIIKKKKRTTLTNKKIFSDFDAHPIHECLDYISLTYDVDKIKNVFLMGDGAAWIKGLKDEFYFSKNTNVIYALDKYHFKQALHHLFLSPEIEKEAEELIIKGTRKNFKTLVDTFLVDNRSRKNTVIDKRDYILNNWKPIKNLYKYNLSCPMELQISHNLADLLTSRPKGYSLGTLKNILNIRMLYKNNENIKYLYLNNFNKKEVIKSNISTLNLEITKHKNSTQKQFAIFSFFNRSSMIKDY